MKRKSLILIMTLFSALGIINMSCERTPSIEEDVLLSALEIELAQDDAVADDIYNEIDASIGQELGELHQNNYQHQNQYQNNKSADDDYTCLTVTVDYPDSTRFPKVITFDYGDGCRVIFMGDTIFKKGKVIVTLTDAFNVPGSQHIITFDEFFVNEIKVEGIRTVTYEGMNEDTLLEMSVTLEGGKLTFPDPETGERLTYTREARLSKQWYRAPHPVEDSVYLEGSIWGVNVYEEDYSREIIETLILANCPGHGRRWVIVDGQILSTVGELSTVIDYGDGACDGSAIVRKERMRHRIRIRERHRHRTGGRM